MNISENVLYYADSFYITILSKFTNYFMLKGNHSTFFINSREVIEENSI